MTISGRASPATGAPAATVWPHEPSGMKAGLACVGYQIPTSTGGPSARGWRSTMKPALSASAGEAKAATARLAAAKRERSDMAVRVVP